MITITSTASRRKMPGPGAAINQSRTTDGPKTGHDTAFSPSVSG